MDTRSIGTYIDPTADALVSGPCWAGFRKMIVFKYKSNVSKPLNYIETSFFILMLCLAPFLMGCSLSSRIDNDSFSVHIQRVYLEED